MCERRNGGLFFHETDAQPYPQAFARDLRAARLRRGARAYENARVPGRTSAPSGPGRTGRI